VSSAVMIAVDTHKASNTAAVLDPVTKMLIESARFANTADGYVQLAGFVPGGSSGGGRWRAPGCRCRGGSPGRRARAASRPARRRQPSLISSLIHPRPAPFTDGRHESVRAGHGRWRPPVNAGQHCWKACWGQPLASSNLASSATLTCDDALRPGSPAAPSPERMSHFLSQLSPGHMSYSGQTDLVAELDDSCCAWSGTSRTRMNRAAHAAKSCASACASVRV
jgi:hypothetical protein